MTTEAQITAVLAAAAQAPPGVGEAINRNWDRLIADQMDPQKAVELLLAAASKGEDVDAFTTHLLKLRAAFNAPAPDSASGQPRVDEVPDARTPRPEP